ncbi:MAG: efflux RND transporter periplasmic adaptor subunit [Bacteroidales bacterium]|jgi:RND family efflux transporter MFP subunit|nr:efflux RND transporter periplasmic adaptor subunit [Bacteroidales bacterium]
MNKINKITALAATIIFFAGCSEKKTSIEVETEQAEIVEIITLQKEKVAHVLTLSTTLQGYETMNVSPSVQGNIERIHVEVGSRVQKGDFLVTMNQTQLNTTRLAFANLITEIERLEALKQIGSISQQNYDQLKLGYDQTKESLAFFEKNTFVKAEFSGIITAKYYENGELFTGIPIVVLMQINNLKSLINIPESYYPLVKEGKKVKLLTDIYPDKNFMAIIETVYPTIDPSTHTFQVKLKIANTNEILRPGMFARATIEMGEIESLLVPYQTVLKLQGSNERYIFLNEDGIAKRIVVTLGQRFDDRIEIISDEIKEGDQIVSAGQSRLVTGMKLNVKY